MNSSSDLIQLLIDEKQTKLKNLLELIEQKFDFCLVNNTQQSQNINEIVLKLKTNIYLIEKIWSYNMVKCVDATPVLSNLVIIENEKL